MAVPFHKMVTSRQAVASSIETDHQVYRWFTFLIVQPGVQSRLSADTAIRDLYGKFRRTVQGQRIVYLAGLGGTVLILVSGRWEFFWALPIVLLAIIPLHLAKKKSVVQISSHLLNQDFADDVLMQKTLYQIAEHYSRQYAIPSLVDAIYALDWVARYAIIAAFVIVNFIHPFPINVAICVFSLIGAYYLAYGLVSTSSIYRRLK